MAARAILLSFGRYGPRKVMNQRGHIMNILKHILVVLTLQTIAISALAQAPYFDLALFKEIIECAKNPEPADAAVSEERIAQTAQRLSDFFTSTNFAFNDSITHSILRNSQLFVGAFRDIKRKFQIGHVNYSQLVDPKFRIDLVPNINFIRALMRVHSAGLKEIAETASKTLDVMAYADRNEASYAAIFYHHCLMVAAVGINNSNCIKDQNIQLSKDKQAIARFERAYIMTYRISRLAFGQFHPEIKLKNESNVIFQGKILLNFTVVKDAQSLIYHQDSAMSEEQFAQTTFFKKSELQKVPECAEVTKELDAISAIFNSQSSCSAGTISFGLFGSINPCFYQNNEGNRRKVIVPTIGTEFSSLFFIREKKSESVYSDYKTAILQPACPKTPRNYEFDEIDY